MESREDPEEISVVDDEEAEVQAPATGNNQLKVQVHVDPNEMSAVEYAAAVAKLITVENDEIRNTARTIAH